MVEIVADEVFVTLWDIVAVECVSGLLFVLTVNLVVRHEGGSSGIGVAVSHAGALLAVGAVLPLQSDRGKWCIDAAWWGVDRLVVAHAPVTSALTVRGAAARIALCAGLALPLPLPIAVARSRLPLTLSLPFTRRDSAMSTRRNSRRIRRAPITATSRQLPRWSQPM